MPLLTICVLVVCAAIVLLVVKVCIPVTLYGWEGDGEPKKRPGLWVGSWVIAAIVIDVVILVGYYTYVYPMLKTPNL
jgi:hypothetical protein